MALRYVTLLPIILGLTVPHEASARARSVRLTSGCLINLKNDTPNIIDLYNGSKFIYPNSNELEVLQIKEKQNIYVFCPGKASFDSTKVTEDGVLLIRQKPLNPSKSIEKLTCGSNNQFSINGKVVKFVDISCEEQSKTSNNAILRKNAECANGNHYEIGYDLGENYGFLKTIDLCHNKESAHTLWAHAVIEPTAGDTFKTSSTAKSFKTGSAYKGMHMSKEEPYSLRKAFQTLTDILGSSAKASQYLSPKPSDRKFLARGHLIANADKFYKSEQESTYFYANVVPMWQQINANPGNWYFVEEYVRYLALHKQRELDVYAGGYGILELDNRPIHLYRVGEEEQIPVPRVLFKCVVDKTDDEAICFLVVNNPYVTKAELESVSNGYLMCNEDRKCDYITENHDDTTLGYMYCCSLKNFYNSAHKTLGLENLKNYINSKPMALPPYK